MTSSSSDSDHDTRQETYPVKPPAYSSGPNPIPYTAPYPEPYQGYTQPQPFMGPPPPRVGEVRQTAYYTTNAQGQQVYVSQVTRTNDSSTYENLRGAIPIMPMPLAVLCCIINFCLPGFGTITASFSVFCCASVGLSTGGKFGCFCLNFWIGWLQLFTVWIFLFGWIWSIIWGWAFIVASTEYYNTPAQGTTTTVITQTPVNDQTR